MADNFFTANQESANFFTPPQKEADSTVDQKVIGDTALAAAIEALHTKGATHQELIDNLGRADAELRGTGQVFRYSQAVQKVRADTIEKRRKRVEDIIFSDLPADKKKEALLTEQGTSEEDISYSDAVSQADVTARLQRIDEETGMFHGKDEDTFLNSKEVKFTADTLYKSKFLDVNDGVALMKFARRLQTPENAIYYVSKATKPEELQAMVGSLFALSAKEWTWDGVVDQTKTEITSVTNWAMLGTGIGAGAVLAKLVAKGTVKKAVADIIMNRLTALAVGGATSATVTDVTTQSIEKTAGYRDEISIKQAATAATIGATVGVVGGELITKAVGGVNKIATKSVTAATRYMQNVVKTGQSPLTPLQNVLSILGPKPEGVRITPMGVVDMRKSLQGSLFVDPVEKAIADEEIITGPMSPEDLAKFLDSAKVKAIKAAEERFYVANPAESSVFRDGDLLFTKLAITKSSTEHFKTISEIKDILVKLKSETAEDTEFRIFKQQADGKFEVLSKKAADKIIAAEEGGQTVTGNYMLQFNTKALASGDFAAPFNPDSFKGFTSKLGKWLSYSAQHGSNLFTPISWAVGKTSKIQKMLEVPFERFSKLGVFDQYKVEQLLDKGDTNKMYFDLDSATKELDGNVELAKVYMEVVDGIKRLHKVADLFKTQEARKDGFRFMSFSDNGKVIYKGAARPVDKVQLGTFLVDENGAEIEVTAAIQKQIADGEVKAYNIYKNARITRASGEINDIDTILIPTNKGIKTMEGRLNSVLSKVEGYAPRAARPVYIVVKKVAGRLYNGIPKPTTEKKLVAGESYETVAFADTEFDAKSYAGKMDRDTGEVHEVRLTRELTSAKAFSDDGLRIGGEGTVFGQRSTQEIHRIKGSGNPQDLISALTEYTGKVANIAGMDRAISHAEEKWVETFAQGKKFPHNRNDAAVLVGGGSRDVLSAQAESKAALAAWDAIEVQRGMMNSFLKKSYTEATLKTTAALSKIPVMRSIMRAYNREIAKHGGIERTARSLAMIKYIASSAQWGLALAASMAETTPMLLKNPNGFGRILRNVTKSTYDPNTILWKLSDDTGFLSAVERNEMLGYNVSSSRAKSSTAGLALKAAEKGVKKYGYEKPIEWLFTKPTKMQRFVALAISLELNTKKAGIKLSSYADLDSVKGLKAKIVADASILDGSMDRSGKIPVYDIPVLGSFAMYTGWSYKMTSLLASGIPGLDKLPIAQKVLDKKYAQAIVGTSVISYGMYGGSVGETYEDVKRRFNIQVDPLIDKYVKSGFLGNAFNFAAETLTDDEVDQEYPARYSLFSGTGFDMGLRFYKTMSQLLAGDINPEGYVNSNALVKMGIDSLDYIHTVSAMYSVLPDEVVAGDDKLLAAAVMAAEEYAPLRGPLRAFDAYRTGLLRDRYGHVLQKVGAIEAIDRAFGVQTAEEKDYYTATKLLSNSKASANDIDEQAKSFIKMYNRVLFKLQQSGAKTDEIKSATSAAIWVMDLDIPDHEKVAVRERIGKYMSGELSFEYAESLSNRLALLATKLPDGVDYDTIKGVIYHTKALTDREKEALLNQMKSNEENGTRAEILSNAALGIGNE